MRELPKEIIDKAALKCAPDRRRLVSTKKVRREYDLGLMINQADDLPYTNSVNQSNTQHCDFF
jgi:hypothetical protein